MLMSGVLQPDYMRGIVPQENNFQIQVLLLLLRLLLVVYTKHSLFLQYLVLWDLKAPWLLVKPQKKNFQVQGSGGSLAVSERAERKRLPQKTLLFRGLLVFLLKEQSHLLQENALNEMCQAVIIDRSRHQQACDTTQVDDNLQRHVTETKLCWAVCESLQYLTHRSVETHEGWMIYELQRDIEIGLRLEKAYAPSPRTKEQTLPI
ncbi:hypothetical protein BGX38DRAFT_1142022 [Terfezia claveryi]|nr:hypothetical protein BGX38DRAFT_1142022 [Terfezia claveryi]